MGPMGELGALFNPGMRHELAERKSKALRREEEGNAGDGELKIDLESGTATIKIPAAGGTIPPDADEDAGRTDPDDDDLGAQDPDDADVSDESAVSQPAVVARPRVTGKSGRRRSA